MTNHINVIFFLALSVAFVSPAVVYAASREEFCQRLAELESHMAKKMMAYDNSTDVSEYECTCSELDMNDNFVVDCSSFSYGVIEENATHGDEVVPDDAEQIVFELNQGEYFPVKIVWPGDSVKGIPEAIFHLDNKEITSCKFNACKSCTICDDKKSIEVDCTVTDSGWDEDFSDLWESEEDYMLDLGIQNYTIDCGERVAPSFAMTYDFGVIMGDGGGDEDNTPQDLTTNGSITRETLCKELAALEAHMDESLEDEHGVEFTTSHVCTCNEHLAKSFTIDCSMQGSDERNEEFVYSEQIVFESDQGKYKLIEASWKNLYEYSSENPEDDKDDRYYDHLQEVFYFTNGVVTGCESKACYVCNDKDQNYTVDKNHTSASDCEDYTDPFALMFDFGVVRESSSPSHAKPSNQVAARGGVFVSFSLAIILAAQLC